MEEGSGTAFLASFQAGETFGEREVDLPLQFLGRGGCRAGQN